MPPWRFLRRQEPVPRKATAAGDAEQAVRFRLSTVAQAFVDLQQGRHKADYDVAEPFQRSTLRWMSRRPGWHL
jgi:hypothetical protein